MTDIGPNYREEIDRLLEPVPETNEQILWIGETPRITIPNAIEAFLDSAAYSLLPSDALEPRRGYHINSRLADAGSDWPIRVEIVSPTTGFGDMVLLYFYRNKQFRT